MAFSLTIVKNLYVYMLYFPRCIQVSNLIFDSHELLL